MYNKLSVWVGVVLFPAAQAVHASEGEIAPQHLTGQWMAWLCILFFILAYLLVAGEDRLSLRKSKPMLVASGLIWILVAVSYNKIGDSHTAQVLFRNALEFYVELFLFLLASTTYLNAMSERNVFGTLRQKVMSGGASLRAVYWVTGLLTFVFSIFLANFAVAMVLVSVLLVLGKDNRNFIVCGCINLVVAANAGGCFSPFGDVTTLMVWQEDLLGIAAFLKLFLPSLVNWLVPALILSFGFDSRATSPEGEKMSMPQGAWIITGLFVFTLLSTAVVKAVFGLPPVIGMMTGLGLLKLYGYRLKRRGITHTSTQTTPGKEVTFDIFRALERSEWDTLMFMYGILVSISGLAALGYLEIVSTAFYGEMGPTTANIVLGILSALIDNAAVMYGVILMHPEMSQWHWLLITLTAGVGGSLLLIGSAAGVVVMGFSEGQYTFVSHLRWIWAVALGYAASIGVHYFINH
ncbi:MAG: Na(+)/H(+) antiporter NhaD [Gammaproteobacteria bacterium]|nr:Na(+)/H(+) antiporter NhaD [Gammaproteobacteria bacterium]